MCEIERREVRRALGPEQGGGGVAISCAFCKATPWEDNKNPRYVWGAKSKDILDLDSQAELGRWQSPREGTPSQRVQAGGPQSPGDLHFPCAIE